ncbi:MAG: response regulator transcription factor [Bacteroidota bacterium]|nr:response regulator transcription factor [Bacteroidota bacterium]
MSITGFKKRIVIIEDDSELAKGFELIINSSPRFTVINTYSTCEGATKNLKQDKPDVILMDIQLPGMNGIEGTRAIKNLNSLLEIIIVTVYDSSDVVFEALKAGASGYITKGANYTELLDALEEITQGGAPMSSRIARMVIENFRVNPDSPLTRRESQILSLISQGKTYTEIADELSISKETSKTHIRNIYQKLQVKTKSEALKKATNNRLI